MEKPYFIYVHWEIPLALFADKSLARLQHAFVCTWLVHVFSAASRLWGQTRSKSLSVARERKFRGRTRTLPHPVASVAGVKSRGEHFRCLRTRPRPSFCAVGGTWSWSGSAPVTPGGFQRIQSGANVCVWGGGSSGTPLSPGSPFFLAILPI